MTLGKQNNEEMMTPEAHVIRKDDGEKDVIEEIAEIAVNKNRERFAINKSYSIEVCNCIVYFDLKCIKCIRILYNRMDIKELQEILLTMLNLKLA